MSAAIRPRRHHSVFLPVLLLLGGVLLLLYNLDFLPEGAGWRLLEISPLILVMLGLQVLIGRGVAGPHAGAAALAAVGIVGLLGLAYVALGPSLAAGTYTRFTSSSPVAGVGGGTLTIDGAAAKVSIVVTDTGTDLYRAQVDYAGGAPKLTYQNGELHLSSANRVGIEWGGKEDRFLLTLSRAVPWTITINGAATTTRLDMIGGRLSSFMLNGVAADAELTLSEPSGTVPVEVSGVAAKLTVNVPAGVQYRARADGLVTTVSGKAESSGWAATADRYDVSGQGIATQVRVQVR